MDRLTTHRQIANVNDLVDALKATGAYDVTVAQFTHHHPSFREQMKLVRENTDILVGIHGAGLTHLLFLPNWAAVFELYHCDDPSCYRDLARLRGVKHIAWTNESLVYHIGEDGADIGSENANKPAYAKFRNYKFDKQEFLSKIQEAENHVKSHPDFNSLKIEQNRVSRTDEIETSYLENNYDTSDIDIKSTQARDEL